MKNDRLFFIEGTWKVKQEDGAWRKATPEDITDVFPTYFSHKDEKKPPESTASNG